jgi:hypothetical protein
VCFSFVAVVVEGKGSILVLTLTKKFLNRGKRGNKNENLASERF